MLMFSCEPHSEPAVHFPKAFVAMAVRTSGSEWWTPARWRVGIEIDPSPTRVKTLRVWLELESLESTLESQKKTPYDIGATLYGTPRLPYGQCHWFVLCLLYIMSLNSYILLSSYHDELCLFHIMSLNSHILLSSYHDELCFFHIMLLNS